MRTGRDKTAIGQAAYEERLTGRGPLRRLYREKHP
jgi:hypothetical protein